MARRQVVHTYGRHRQRVVSLDVQDVFTNNAPGKNGHPFSSFSSSGSSGFSKQDSLEEDIKGRHARKNNVLPGRHHAKENAFQTPDWVSSGRGNRAAKPDCLIDISNFDLSKSTASSDGIFKSAERNASCRIQRNKSRPASALKPYTTAKKSQRKKLCSKTTGKKKTKLCREPIGVAKRNLKFLIKQSQEDSINASHGSSNKMSFSEFDKYSLIVSDSAASPVEADHQNDNVEEDVPPTPDIELKSTKKGEKTNTLTSTPHLTRTMPKSDLYKNLLHDSEISHIESILETPEPIGCRTRAQISKYISKDQVSHLDFTNEPSMKCGIQLQIEEYPTEDCDPDMSVEACSIAMDRLGLSQDVPNHSKSGMLGASGVVDACSTPFRTYNVSARYPTRSKCHLNIPHITSDSTNFSESSIASNMSWSSSELQTKTANQKVDASLHECYIRLEKLCAQHLGRKPSSENIFKSFTVASQQTCNNGSSLSQPTPHSAALLVPNLVAVHEVSHGSTDSSYDGSKSLFSSSAHSQFTERSSRGTPPSIANKSIHLNMSVENSVAFGRRGSELLDEESDEVDSSGDEESGSVNSAQECSEKSEVLSKESYFNDTTEQYSLEKESMCKEIPNTSDSSISVAEESDLSVLVIIDSSQGSDTTGQSNNMSADVSRYMLADETVGTGTNQGNQSGISESKTGSFHSCESKDAMSMERSQVCSEADMSMDDSITRRRKPKNKLLHNVQSELETSCVSVKDILTPVKMKGTGRFITAREKILLQCSQLDVISFSECITPVMMKKCVKIGEGVYGEVFKTDRNKEHVALKIIPIEGDFSVNDEPQKHFDEMIPEIVITKELSQLREGGDNSTENFVQVKGISLVQGSYPEKLLRQWDEFHAKKISENDRPDIFGNEQQFIVFEFEDAGRDLEGVTLDNMMQARSILFQVTCSLAIAEVALQFEHRDLHWGNILVKETEEETLWYSLDGQEVGIDMCGVKVSIIDFTLSRLSKDACSVFTDLSTDPTLFEGQGDYQFDVYRLMKEENTNKWKAHHPFTNVLWVHYLADKLLNGKSYSNSKSREHKSLARQFRTFLREALDYRSALHLLRHCPFFSE